MTRRLSRNGVAVLDVEAEALHLEAVNAYLEIKRRGVL